MAAFRPNRPRLELTLLEFEEICGFVAEKTGLTFSVDKKREFEDKLQDYYVDHGFTSGRQVIEALTQSDSELQCAVNDLTIGESYFFRNRPHFDALRTRIIPALIKKNAATRHLDIWSAASSTGEEAYSIIIMLKEHFPELNDWTIDVLATDINTDFLSRARRAHYNRWSFRGVEKHLIDKYFERVDDNEYQLQRDIADGVTFRTFNLADLPYTGRLPVDSFDLILCRNVLIYFSFDFANQVVENLAGHVSRGGYLVVGHAESFPALSILELIYSNATYYYHHSAVSARRTMAPMRSMSIPGIGITDGEVSPWIRFDSLAPVSEIPKLLTIPPPSTESLRQRHSLMPNPLDSELSQARVLADIGDIQGATAILDRLIAGPGKLDSRVHFLVAILADQAGSARDAVTALKQAIFLDRDFVVAHYYLGTIYDREGDSKHAQRYLRNVRNLVDGMADEAEIEEAGGLLAGSLKEIVRERIRELQLE